MSDLTNKRMDWAKIVQLREETDQAIAELKEGAGLINRALDKLPKS